MAVMDDEPSWRSRFSDSFPSSGTPKKAGPYEEMFGIGALAKRLGVSVRAIEPWMENGDCPECPIWSLGADGRGNRRRFTARMIDQVVQAAEACGLLGRRRWDIAGTDFYQLVARAWYASKPPNLDPSLLWCVENGKVRKPEPAIDYSSPAKVRAAMQPPPPAQVDYDEVIDLSTDEARELNNAGTPIILKVPRPWWRRTD